MAARSERSQRVIVAEGYSSPGARGLTNEYGIPTFAALDRAKQVARARFNPGEAETTVRTRTPGLGTPNGEGNLGSRRHLYDSTFAAGHRKAHEYARAKTAWTDSAPSHGRPLIEEPGSVSATVKPTSGRKLDNSRFQVSTVPTPYTSREALLASQDAGQLARYVGRVRSGELSVEEAAQRLIKPVHEIQFAVIVAEVVGREGSVTVQTDAPLPTGLQGIERIVTSPEIEEGVDLVNADLTRFPTNTFSEIVRATRLAGVVRIPTSAVTATLDTKIDGTSYLVYTNKGTSAVKFEKRRELQPAA